MFNKAKRDFILKKSVGDICNKYNLNRKNLYRLVRDENWLELRNRYMRYICYISYKKGISLETLAAEKQISASILYRIKRKYNIVTKRFSIHNKMMNNELKKLIIQMYNNGISSNKISSKLGFKTGKTVLDVLKKNNITRRSYSDYSQYNRDYFSKIDSNDKAYILGLCLTDGYVLKNYSGIGIQLQISDKEVLESIAKRLGDSCSIKEISYKKRRLQGKKSKDMVRFLAHCPEISRDLSKFGVVKRKSLILQLPDIEDKYYSHFLRGLIDGDGSLGFSNSGVLWANIVSGSEVFCINLSHKLTQIGFKNTFLCKKPSQSTFKVSIGGGQCGIIDFVNWIYRDKGDLYIKRKYEKMQDKIS